MKTLKKFKKKLLKYVAKNLPCCSLRIFLYKKCGYIIGEQVYIAEGLTIAEKLEDTDNLIIGNRVAIGPNVTLLTSSDPNNSRIKPYVKTQRGRILIEDDAWIGAGSIIMPDIIIAKGAVVGAGSVVTRNVDPYHIVAGVPAKTIKKVEIP
jgi:acetyltransferase-like isoleucine patch superfamily enzyme